MSEKVVELLYQAWADADNAVRGLKDVEAEARRGGLNSVAWIVGHLGQQVDSWFNVRFQGREPNSVLASPLLQTGAIGTAPSWAEVVHATREARENARVFLDMVSDADLERVVPYTGSIEYLRPRGLQLRYALMRTAAHHFQHVGEILTLRALMGHRVDESGVWGLWLL
jgi:hypothetical protein